jgi:hypothetical protein
VRRRLAGAALGLAGAAACAGWGGAESPAGVDAGRPTQEAWTRVVAPFPVLDPHGNPYDHPFLGGFDVPRPQLIDIDADGDLDLFIQERSGELMFLENTGTPEAAHHVWRTDRFAGLDIGEWYRFADMDADGDQDLIAEEPFSYIRYYRNDGGPDDPRFTLAADTLRTVDGEPLFSDRQNIPNAADFDCDGLVDLFVGRLSGTVSRYEAVAFEGGVPRFELLSERFGDIEIVANFVGSLHGANTMDLADPDGDGDLDLFWGDFFEAGLLLLENTGSCTSPVIRNEPVPFPPDAPLLTSGYNAPAVGDLDGDGLPDMLVGVLGGAYNPTRTARENLYFMHQGFGGWELRGRRYLAQIDLGSETVPAWIDDDGDGDLDLLVGSKIDADSTETGLVHRFENTGTAGGPELRYDGRLPMRGAYHYAPEAGDLDGDGRVDLLLGTWNDGVRHYRNVSDGPGRWLEAAGPIVELTRGSHTTPALGDLDGDGDLDLVVGEASGTLNYYRNDGGPEEPAYELVSDEWLGVDVGRRSHPALVDLDGDGDLDLVVGNEAGRMTLFRNHGDRSAFEFRADPDADLPAFPFAAPAFADIEGDERPELVSGALGGGVVYYRP